MPASPSQIGGAGMTTVLDNVAALLQWCYTSMTSITSWLVGNSLGAIYIGMFIIGFAVALMYRILKSS